MSLQKSEVSHQNDETFTPETLQQLREEINAFINQEQCSSLALNSHFQDQLESFSRAGLLEEEQGWRLSEFLLGLREKMEEKSRNMGCLAQVGLKMIDFLSEQRQQQSLARSRYEQAIEELQQQNLSLSSRNITIENDVEYFRQRLEATEGQLENIVTQESEGRDEDQSSNAQSLRDKQIELLEKQLEEIREEIQRYKHGIRYRQEKNAQELPHPRYVRMRSQYSMLGESVPNALDLQLNECRRRIEVLEAENIRLQRDVDISQNKVRSRRSSKISVKESKAFELIPEQTGEETERKNEEDEAVMEASPSTLSLLHRGNLLGDIRESLESSNSCLDASNRLICISSNRSLFANLELRDLVKDELEERASIKRLKNLEIQSAIFQETVDPLLANRHQHDVGAGTETKILCERSTTTEQERERGFFLKWIILKPVDMLIRTIWRSGYGAGCIG